MNQKIDFTNCPRVLDRAFNGANGKKIAVEYNGRPYMLKFPPSGNGKPTELSYTNSCVSEHIASSIFNMLGIKAQETMLGTFSVNEKEKIVCACLDFTEDGKKFYDFCSIKNTVLDSDSNGSGTELEDILETIEKQQYVDPIVLKEHFLICLLQMLCSATLTVITATGVFYMIRRINSVRLHLSMTAEAVCCRRLMTK